jgi:preprotein translocase subunit SecA
MLNFIIQKIIGTQNERELKRYLTLIGKINSFEDKVSALSDNQLRAKTDEFKKIIRDKENELKNELTELEDKFIKSTPEDREKVKEDLKNIRRRIFELILPEAFAVVREAAKRTVGMRHFDMQLVGGMVLHDGRISEMATGEGKTLVATLPAYLNALTGKGVHIVTVNDYLAKRDREWMGPIYEFLGLTVGVIQHDMPPDVRKFNYGCDITYGTNNEFGFDYLRDNMVVDKSDMVQREFYFAIVDEVDSILIDEARTPLIISGPAEESTQTYYSAQKIARELKGRRITQKDEIDAKYDGRDLYEGVDYIADEKANTISLSEDAEAKVAKMFGIESLHDIDTIEYRHHINAALKAKEFFEKDVDYVVKDGEVIIVDEFTGRLMPGRRWSDGLHQAVEAKEGMKIARENQTLATITLQNYFRMYEKLSGMTGTAFTESAEFKHIYNLDVIVIPTNRKLIRANHPDCVYKTQVEKFDAVVSEIISCYEKGRPVLVGTISIEKSEMLSGLLKMRGIPHNVLNAKYHEREAHIVAQAGRYQAVTIATNMAGRGTDILLGGNPEFMAKALIIQEGIKPEDAAFLEAYKKKADELKVIAKTEHEKVVEVGGLHVIGTERHESRRIDNQLRGRSGRQGDPGSSRFYVSLEDELMRLFGSDRLIGLMDKLGLEKGQVIEHPWVSKSIEIAQKRVEGHNFEIRKHLLEYDNVMNKQREIIYSERKSVLTGASLKEKIRQMYDDFIYEAVDAFIADGKNEIEPLIAWVFDKFNLKLAPNELIEKSDKEITELLENRITSLYEEKERSLGEDIRYLERMIMLQIIDTKWKEHLYAMDYLREGIGLRSYGQRDPLVEYQREAFNNFENMVYSVKEEFVSTIFKIKLEKDKKVKAVFELDNQQLVHQEVSGLSAGNPRENEKPSAQSSTSPSVNPDKKVGRNDPCPCGSGKKYKKCCGK